MKRRCQDKKDRNYHNYGGRGIKICDRWLGVEGFTNFVQDMGLKPTPKHSIDRINNDGNYEPSNCRWATIHEQAMNRRVTVATPGVHWNKAQQLWSAELEIDGVRHIRTSVTLEQAIIYRREYEDAYLLKRPGAKVTPRRQPKLTDQQIINIRHIGSTIYQHEIAELYGVSRPFVSMVLNNKWRKL